MDLVAATIVKGTVILIVMNLRAGVVENLFAGLHDLPLLPQLRFIGRYAVNLLGVENRVDPPDRAARGIGGRGVIVLCPAISLRELPKFDVGSLLTLADLPALFLRLLVGHPSWVLVAATRAHCNEVERIAATVASVRGRVEGQFECAGFPGLLPWSDAVFKHLDD